jgi:LmbE family N-acetylglucosaminyl deacetylase
MSETILFLCAHNDDQLLGAGGTIARWSREGKKVVTIIFSFGELSNPLEQDIITRKTRVKESKLASKILGEDELFYIGLKESRFEEEIEEKRIHEKIGHILKRIKPSKIFTHNLDDPHPDHKAVYRFTLELIKEMDYRGEVYSFNIWNYFLNFRHRDLPRLVVDITDTFSSKVEAFRKHKSQSMTIFFHMWSVYFQAMMHGLNNNMKYAEVFYKIK